MGQLKNQGKRQEATNQSPGMAQVENTLVTSPDKPKFNPYNPIKVERENQVCPLHTHTHTQPWQIIKEKNKIFLVVHLIIKHRIKVWAFRRQGQEDL